jgi:hypothetical protein
MRGLRLRLVKVNAWYSTLTFRKRPIGLVLVADDRSWGQVKAEVSSKIHPTVGQFIVSQVGALSKRIDRGDVPRRRDLDFLAGKFSGDVRLSTAMPIVSSETQGEMWERLWRSIA